MVGNALEQQIIGLYNRDIAAWYSINQIAKLLKRSYPHINRKVGGLIREGVLRRTVLGHAHFCTVNLASDKAIWLLGLNDIGKKGAAAHGTSEMEKITQAISELRSEPELVLKTDDCLLFVVKKRNQVPEQVPGNMKVCVCTEKEFVVRLSREEVLLTKRVILHGFEKYYHYLRKADIRRELWE